MDKSKILVNAAPIARDVKFSDGTEEKLHFRQPNAGEFKRWHADEKSDDPEVQHYAMQRLIAVCLVDEKGKRVLNDAEALGLTASGVGDLFPHVLAVAGIDRAAKKESPSVDGTGSATS